VRHEHGIADRLKRWALGIALLCLGMLCGGYLGAAIGGFAGSLAGGFTGFVIAALRWPRTWPRSGPDSGPN